MHLARFSVKILSHHGCPGSGHQHTRCGRASRLCHAIDGVL